MKSERYYLLIEQYKKIHLTKRYGANGDNKAKHIVPHVNFKVNSVLDYGCGRSNLAGCVADELGAKKAYKYDPAIEEYQELLTEKVDLLVCTDVLEHIPEEDLGVVLQEMKSLTDKCFFSISTRKAFTVLPNGENAHAMVKDANWWAEKIDRVFGCVEMVRVKGVSSRKCVFVKTWRNTENGTHLQTTG